MSDPTLDIGTLLKAHREGDPTAFEKILGRFENDLWGFLVNRVQARHDAEDLYQEINLKVYRNLGSLKDPGKIRSWLFSIALNSVRSFFRKKPELSLVTTDQEDKERVFDVVSPEPGADSGLEKAETLKRLRQCILRLPQRDREILLLDVMADVPQQDIARQMDLNTNTVKTILRRAKIKLARMMAEAEHE